MSLKHGARQRKSIAQKATRTARSDSRSTIELAGSVECCTNPEKIHWAAPAFGCSVKPAERNDEHERLAKIPHCEIWDHLLRLVRRIFALLGKAETVEHYRNIARVMGLFGRSEWKYLRVRLPFVMWPNYVHQNDGEQ